MIITMTDSPIELVVARHQEDLRWLRRVPTKIRITVYNKGTDLDPGLVGSLSEDRRISFQSLPNIGLEAHTYLHHLVSRYDSLASVTVFCQGHPFDHAPDLHDRLCALAEGIENPDPFLWYGFLDDTDDPFGRRLFMPWSKNPERRELQTGRLYEELFAEPSPEFFHFRCGAQFAVTAAGVKKRPLGFYQRAMELSLTFPLAVHSLERMWDRFFGEPAIDAASLGPEGVRYHKRIRRLELRKAEQGDS
jgi:hypothetical protein